MSRDQNPRSRNRPSEGYTRREFLRIASAAPLALAHARAVQAASLGFKPAAFDATHNSVQIWLKGEGAGRVRVDFTSEANATEMSSGPSADLTSNTDFCATIPLTQLVAGKTWTYRVVEAESGKPLSQFGRFKTAPSNSVPFTFVFSADMDESYQPFKLFDVIDSKQPDFFLHLGDTIYADLRGQRPFAPSVAHYRNKHVANRKDPHLQNFFSRHVTYAIWDDHETENNCHSLNPFMDNAFQVFKEFWPCTGVVPNALYRQFNWAGVDFFILDTRRFRTPQATADGPEKTMLGAAQKSWLKDALKASTAPFKFVVTSVPFQGGGEDTWGSYPTERSEIASFIRAEKIAGIIFLSGDYHLARDWSNPKTGTREYMAGPIASFTHYKNNPEARARYQKAGTFHYGDGYNFGLWHVDPAGGKARIEFIGAGGETMFQTEVTV